MEQPPVVRNEPSIIANVWEGTTVRAGHFYNASKVIVVRIYNLAMASVFFTASATTLFHFERLNDKYDFYWWEGCNSGNFTAHAVGIFSPEQAQDILDGKTKKDPVKEVKKEEDPKIENKEKLKEKKVEKPQEKKPKESLVNKVLGGVKDLSGIQVARAEGKKEIQAAVMSRYKAICGQLDKLKQGKDKVTGLSDREHKEVRKALTELRDDVINDALDNFQRRSSSKANPEQVAKLAQSDVTNAVKSLNIRSKGIVKEFLKMAELAICETFFTKVYPNFAQPWLNFRREAWLAESYKTVLDPLDSSLEESVKEVGLFKRQMFDLQQKLNNGEKVGDFEDQLNGLLEEYERDAFICGKFRFHKEARCFTRLNDGLFKRADQALDRFTGQSRVKFHQDWMKIKLSLTKEILSLTSEFYDKSISRKKFYESFDAAVAKAELDFADIAPSRMPLSLRNAITRSELGSWYRWGPLALVRKVTVGTVHTALGVRSGHNWSTWLTQATTGVVYSATIAGAAYVAMNSLNGSGGLMNLCIANEEGLQLVQSVALGIMGTACLRKIGQGVNARTLWYQPKNALKSIWRNSTKTVGKGVSSVWGGTKKVLHLDDLAQWGRWGINQTIYTGIAGILLSAANYSPVIHNFLPQSWWAFGLASVAAGVGVPRLTSAIKEILRPVTSFSFSGWLTYSTISACALGALSYAPYANVLVLPSLPWFVAESAAIGFVTNVTTKPLEFVASKALNVGTRWAAWSTVALTALSLLSGSETAYVDLLTPAAQAGVVAVGAHWVWSQRHVVIGTSAALKHRVAKA